MFANYTYHTDVRYVSGLLSNTSDGVNHAGSVAVNGLNAVDGLVAVMQVKIVKRPESESSYVLILCCIHFSLVEKHCSGALSISPISIWTLVALVAMLHPFVSVIY